MALGFQTPAIWPLGLIGAGLAIASLIGRTWWQAGLFGFVTGAGFWLPLIDWLTLYLGPVPWLALAGFMALWFAVFAVPTAFVLSRSRPFVPPVVDRFVVAPVGVAGLWTLRETLSSVWPWGGYSWGRLAESQSNGPLLEVVSWTGMLGLSFVLALLVTEGVQFVRYRRDFRAGRAHSAAAGIVALTTLGLALLPAFPTASAGTTRIAAVQGNTDSSLFTTVPVGSITDDHIAATLPVLDSGADVVIWPENGMDVNPLDDAQAAAQLEALSERAGAPFIVGTITTDDDGEFFNSSLLWDAGPVDQYDKLHPVAFAEFMPARDLFMALAPDLVVLVTRDYQVGQRDPIFDVAGTHLGVAICYDTADDEVMRNIAALGGEAIVLQTNNADFGDTDERRQQLAITRMRAVETGRTVVNISTVSASAVIAPDGSTVDSLPDFEAGAMVDDIELRTGLTPAVVIGTPLQWTLGLLGLATFAATLIAARMARPAAPAPD